MTGAASASAATSDWWDLDWPLRQNLAITTGGTAPDKGYDGYTVRLTLDTATLINDDQLANDCSDLRVLYWDGSAWTVVPYHLIDCDSASSDLRFSLQADISNNSTDDNYYLYYSNPNASAPAPLTPTNVYLWYDDAQTNRVGTGTGTGRSGSSYVHGRMDAWHGTNWDDSTSWNAAGYYEYDTGDNFTSGYRQAVNERDVLIEAELFHTGCYQINMTTGLATRIITSGSGSSESSSNYIAAHRGHNSNCGTGYGNDGDVEENQRTNTAIAGPDPPAVTLNQWRKQALATFGGGTTEVRYWEDDNGWSTLGWPAASVGANVSSSYSTSVTSRGEAGLITAQDSARWRGMLIRRFVEPEPSVALNGGTEVKVPNIAVNHTVDQPTRDPGTVATWQVTATNNGDGSADTVIFEHDLDRYTFFDLDPTAAPGGPLDGSVSIICVTGCPGSEGIAIDTLAFSDDGGATFTYTPSSGAGGAPNGYDANVTDVRVIMQGRLARSESVTLEYKAQLR